jgi:hypothetical protein
MDRHGGRGGGSSSADGSDIDQECLGSLGRPGMSSNINANLDARKGEQVSEVKPKERRMFVDDPTTQPSLGRPWLDPETGRDFPGDLPTELSWQFYDLIKERGFDATLAMVTRAAMMVKHDLTEADHWRLRFWLRSIKLIYDVQGGDRLSMALSTTYNLLQNGTLKGWGEAAAAAAKILGKPTDSEAWRKRVTRYARQNGYPEVRIYKRRTSQTDNTT